MRDLLERLGREAGETSSLGTWREGVHGGICESEVEREEHMASHLGPGRIHHGVDQEAETDKEEGEKRGKQEKGRRSRGKRRCMLSYWHY